MNIISIPVAVHTSHFEWQLDLFWYQHKKLYGEDAYNKAHAIIVKRNNPAEEIKQLLQWDMDVPHSMVEAYFDYSPVYTDTYCIPLNIQLGLQQIIDQFDDEDVLEVLDCDMFHLRPHHQVEIAHDELLVETCYEDWHLKSLSDNRSVIDIYFENGGAGYNGGFVPILGTAKTFRKILREWIAVHHDIIQRPYDHTIRWWAGMFALQAACEKAKVVMRQYNRCYIHRATTLKDTDYICHYSVDGDFIHKKNRSATLTRENLLKCREGEPALYTHAFADWLEQSKFLIDNQK